MTWNNHERLRRLAKALAYRIPITDVESAFAEATRSQYPDHHRELDAWADGLAVQVLGPKPEADPSPAGSDPS